MEVSRISKEELEKFSSSSDDGFGGGFGGGYHSIGNFGYSGFGGGSGDNGGRSAGSGSGSGDNEGNGYGYGRWGSGEGSSDGSGAGISDGEGIKAVCGMPVLMINETPTTIVEIDTAGDLAKGYVLCEDMSLSECYVAKCGTCFAHGHTVAEAVKAAKYEWIWEERGQKCT